MLPSLSAFLPARNEEANVIPMAEALLRILPRIARRWELIVVDDGSRDRTGALADELASGRPFVHVVHRPVSRGYGAAVRAGLEAARHEYVFFTDCDRQFDAAQIADLVGALEHADAVVGYRSSRADPLARRLAAAAWNRLVRALFGLPVRDVNCAFKLFRREALADVVLHAEGAVFSTELMARMVERGLRIVEVPVAHFPRRHGEQSGGGLRVIARAFTELLPLYVRLRRSRSGSRQRDVEPAAAARQPRGARAFGRPRA
jgi:glycosyltransferase involved in cell wall biosynthesis